MEIMFIYAGTARNKLSFKARLVWSYIVFRNTRKFANIKRKFASVYKIKTATGLSHNKVKDCLKELDDVGLVARKGIHIIALEPVGEARQWFAWRKKEHKKWSRRLGYFLMNLHSGLSFVNAAILALLTSIAQNKKRHLSFHLVAKLLGVSVAAVSKGVKKLAPQYLSFEQDTIGFTYSITTLDNSKKIIKLEPEMTQAIVNHWIAKDKKNKIENEEVFVKLDTASTDSPYSRSIADADAVAAKFLADYHAELREATAPNTTGSSGLPSGAK